MLSVQGPHAVDLRAAARERSSPLCCRCRASQAGQAGGGVLQSALNPLMPLRAECYGFAAISFACLQIMQPSKLMTRVRFPSPAPRLKIKGLSEILRVLNAH